MLIAVGSDHRGYLAKQRILSLLEKLQHGVLDMGTSSEDSCDYPEFAFRVGHAVSQEEAERGILICGTGIGMCIADNKVPGVRAAPCHDSITAEMSRRHNDANIMCLSADLLGEELMERMVTIWLNTNFEEGRHERRVKRIRDYEQNLRIGISNQEVL